MRKVKGNYSFIMHPRILIAIPAYNCEKQIVRVIDEIANNAEILKEIEQVLIIDNQSPDHTVKAAVEKIEKYESTKFKVIRNGKNIGLGGSQKQAFRWAAQNGFDYLIVLHGDHQARPHESLDLIRIAKQNPHLSAVLGSRFSKGSARYNYSKLRVFGNNVLNQCYSALSLHKVEDLGSGLNIFKVSDFELERLDFYSNQFTFNMDLLLDLIQKRHKFQFYPISWSETDQVSNAKTFKVGWIALKTLLKWRFPVFKKKSVRTGLEFETIKK